MDITNRELLLPSNNRALLDSELPALTARAIDAVVRAAATHEKLCIGGDVNVWFMGSLCDVFKRIWTTRVVGVDALRRDGGRWVEGEQRRRWV